jgi:hypothetical protein
MRIICIPAKYAREMEDAIRAAKRTIDAHRTMSSGEDAPFPGGILEANRIDESRQGSLIVTISELPEDADRLVFALAQLVNPDTHQSNGVAA